MYGFESSKSCECIRLEENPFFVLTCCISILLQFKFSKVIDPVLNWSLSSLSHLNGRLWLESVP